MKTSLFLRFHYVGLNEFNDFETNYVDILIDRNQELHVLAFDGDLENLYRLGVEYSNEELLEYKPQSIECVEIVDYTHQKHVFLYEA